jgi:uncharacterized protein
MIVGTCSLEILLFDVQSLKDKRSILRGLTSRLHKEFNVAAAEVDRLDAHGSTIVGLVVVSTSAVHAKHMLENIVQWLEHNRPDLTLVDHTIEVIAL